MIRLPIRLFRAIFPNRDLIAYGLRLLMAHYLARAAKEQAGRIPYDQ